MIFLKLGAASIAVFLVVSEVIASSVVNYNVVVPPSVAPHVVGVAINDDIYPLTANPTVPMLYSGVAPGETPYRYVIVDSLQRQTILDYEKFQRPAMTQPKTYNEVFGRAWNQLSLPVLPKVYDYPYPVQRDKLFEEGQIATIHFQGDADELDHMHTQTLEEIKVEGTMTYISFDNVQQFENVKLKVGGHSTRKWSKVPYKFKINEENSPEGLFGRFHLKLRSEATDPTMIREKMYNDMLESMGVVTSQGAYVRFYINNLPAGIFLLVDDISTKEFIGKSIHGGDAIEIGPVIKGDAGKGKYAANLLYRGANISEYDDKTYEVKIEGESEGAAFTQLIDFMQFISTYEPSMSEDDLMAWNARMDVDTYLRSMVLEWLTGNWDAHAYAGNNYLLYHKPDANKYVYLPMDFDMTFGNGLEKDQENLATGPYEQFTSNRKVHSYLYEKLITIPAIKARYDAILLDAVTKLFGINTVDPRIGGLAYMLQHEVTWDQALDRQVHGLARSWDAAEYLSMLDEGTSDVDLMYGIRQWISIKENAVKLQLGLVHAPEEVGETETDALRRQANVAAVISQPPTS